MQGRCKKIMTKGCYYLKCEWHSVLIFCHGKFVSEGDIGKAQKHLYTDHSEYNFSGPLPIAFIGIFTWFKPKHFQ